MKFPPAQPNAEAPHRLEVSEVEQILGVDRDRGLDPAEAVRRLETYGPNRIRARGGAPIWLRMARQFHQPLVYILIVAGGLAAWLDEPVDAAVIFGVVLANAAIGFFQESKAEQAIRALTGMLQTEAVVMRGESRLKIPAEEVVPGDVVLLQAGDRVPADLRLFRVDGLRVDESALTGESLPIDKHADRLGRDVVLAERCNQAFAGTLVNSGSAEGLVWAVGDHTETGRIAWLVADAVEISTPLTRKIAAFSRLLLWGILLLAFAAFGVGVLRGVPPSEMFMVSVALAVGAIPEGLPAALTIVLAIGVNRMARQRVMIRKLPAVETLGSTTVICSDKTGTLTENQMTVQEIFAGGTHYTVTGVGYAAEGEVICGGVRVEPAAHPALMECLRAGLLCNDSRILVEDSRHVVDGDPTEAALLVAASKAGLVHEEAVRMRPRLSMIPFDSARMYRATLHGGGRHTIYKVGALEKILPRCADRIDRDGGLAAIDADEIHAAAEQMASRGLRVIALARRHHDLPDGSALKHEHVSHGLTFLGLQAMMDPPRAQAADAVMECRRAGIRVKMVTGDHAATACAIALRIGLTGSDGVSPRAISGAELERMPDTELARMAEAIDVFARIAPEQKLRLVRSLQSLGHIVAMTGDGVNDAPTLKQADIGIAMGLAGTEVAKGAADIVLADDDFSTIRAAVEQGRGVFDNLRKFILWTLPTNIGEGGIVFLAVMFGVTLPALPVQLLWINLTTSVLLGLTLVFEPMEAGLMERPPRPPARPILTVPLMLRTALVSVILIVGGFWMFLTELHGNDGSLAVARTAVINLIVMVETAYLFNCRSIRKTLVEVGWLSNPQALMGAIAMLVAQLAFTYSPWMNNLFQTQPLELDTWLRIIAVAAIALGVIEVEKWIRFSWRGKRPTWQND